MESINPATFLNGNGEVPASGEARFGRCSIPAGTYKTLQGNLSTVGLLNLAIAHKDLPDDLVCGIVKAVMENHARMVQAHPAA